MNILSYHDLDVWQKARLLVKSVYTATSDFPKEEVYGLTSQLRRAAVSVPSNIAEGKARRATKEYMRFLDIAYGSLAEVETQIFLALDLGYITQSSADTLLVSCAEIGKMLNGLLTSLERKSLNPETRILKPEHA